MTSLADAPELIGFFSYSRDDDEDSENALTKLRLRIQNELRAQLGRSRATLRLWQDAEAIAPGVLWEAQIDAAVAQSSFFIPIITPRVVASHYCGFELQKFIDRERALGRSDLVFPILYIGVAELTNERLWRNHAVLRIVGERQYVDWREFRYEPDSVAARRAIAGFCGNIATTLKRAVVSTEQRDDAFTQEARTHGTRPGVDEHVLIRSEVDGQRLGNPEMAVENHTSLQGPVRRNAFMDFSRNLAAKIRMLDYKTESLLILGIVSLVNALYVSAISWLNDTIPYFRYVSFYIPGFYFGLFLCYIQQPKIPKWLARDLTVLFAVLGWYLAMRATIAFFGDVTKIDPENYVASSLGGAIGGIVGISCCLAGLCIGNRGLANSKSLSIVTAIAVAAGSILLPLYLRTSKADLQAWGNWTFWLLLAGWQSLVAIALRNEIRMRPRTAGDRDRR